MSSTGRKDARLPDDFYETPPWCVDALLRRVGALAGKRILEPSAGSGAIVKRLLAAGAEADLIQAVEIDRSRATQVLELGVNCDAWSFEAWAPDQHTRERASEDVGRGFDLIVMNPPFSFAQEHIELAISLLAPGGLCCALERLAFGASKKRASFRARYPYDKLELAARPSFTSRRTDSADYAWFCFGTWSCQADVPWVDAGQHRAGGRFLVLEDHL